ncbi:MAG TPA: hypothetical protein DEF27_00115, partial [Oscillatoriales bacterium UBA8482]|nr:hypothetical protein [Oscillatoriales bacterium UBA8482]
RLEPVYRLSELSQIETKDCVSHPLVAIDNFLKFNSETVNTNTELTQSISLLETTLQSLNQVTKSLKVALIFTTSKTVLAEGFPSAIIFMTGNREHRNRE